MRVVPRLAPLLLAVTVPLLAAEPAAAVTVTRHDRAGRAITFDVRAPRVQVGWYAQLLRNAMHGDEIESVVIRVVPPSRVSRLCGGQAGSCYAGGSEIGTITVPAGRSVETAHSLLHEYAHHIDTSRSGWRRWEEPWAHSWWTARGIDALLAAGRVSFDYDLGWGHSIPEIFAEDYVQLHMRTEFLARWLKPPSRAVRAALRRDLRRQPQ